MNTISSPENCLNTTKKLTFYPRGHFGARGNSSYGISFAQLVRGEMDTMTIDFILEDIRDSSFPGDEREGVLKSIIDSHAEDLKGKNVNIPETRITHGFEVGAIDFAKGAIYRTENAWIDQDGELFAMADMPLDSIKAKVSEYVTILPVLTHEQLSEADETGELYVGGELEAQKIDGQWFIFDQNRSCPSPYNALKVLSQLNIPSYLSNDIQEVSEKMFHGSMERSEDIESGKVTVDKPFNSYGLSLQGNGFYMAELNEVVKTYANGSSAERSSLQFELKERGIDKSYSNKERQGVVFDCELSDSVHYYDANFYSANNVNSTTHKPSPHILNSIISNSKLDQDSKTLLLKNVMGQLSVAETPYDVFIAINKLSVEMSSRNHGDAKENNVMGKLFSSMGYNAVKFTPPTVKDRKFLSDMIESLKNGSGEVHEYLESLSLHPAVKEKFKNHAILYQSALQEPLAPHFDKSNMIVFSPDASKIKFKGMLVLPQHAHTHLSYGETGQVNDAVFDTDFDYNKLTLNQLSKKINMIEKNKELTLEM